MHNAAINVSFLKQTSSTGKVRCYLVASRSPNVLIYCLERQPLQRAWMLSASPSRQRSFASMNRQKEST